jgi:hypothetical protein
VTTTLDHRCSVNMFPTAELIETGEMIGPRGSTGDNITAATAAQADQQPGGRAGDSPEWPTGRGLDQAVRSPAATSVVDSRGGADGQVERDVGRRPLHGNSASIMDGQTGWEHAFGELLYSDGMGICLRPGGRDVLPDARCGRA